mmetsp:Transcript_4134/g.9406  ORF Transcript_4134/g.9406 Transcript_4134/m.9406 type:complete len:235 (+) Transcript_4134:906-1610(+)
MKLRPCQREAETDSATLLCSMVRSMWGVSATLYDEVSRIPNIPLAAIVVWGACCLSLDDASLSALTLASALSAKMLRIFEGSFGSVRKSPGSTQLSLLRLVLGESQHPGGYLIAPCVRLGSNSVLLGENGFLRSGTERVSRRDLEGLVEWGNSDDASSFSGRCRACFLARAVPLNSGSPINASVPFLASCVFCLPRPTPALTDISSCTAFSTTACRFEGFLPPFAILATRSKSA